MRNDQVQDRSRQRPDLAARGIVTQLPQREEDKKNCGCADENLMAVISFIPADSIKHIRRFRRKRVQVVAPVGAADIAFLRSRIEGEFPMENKLSAPKRTESHRPIRASDQSRRFYLRLRANTARSGHRQSRRKQHHHSDTQVMENLKAVVTAAGSSLERVVKTTVFLKNISILPQ
jgi:hypothetical protein